MKMIDVKGLPPKHVRFYDLELVRHLKDYAQDERVRRPTGSGSGTKHRQHMERSFIEPSSFEQKNNARVHRWVMACSSVASDQLMAEMLAEKWQPIENWGARLPCGAYNRRKFENFEMWLG